ncbi:helix-turn-helix domain-containing protein [Pseudodesulfovibrio hydrargyri]|uniref:helix-turn-helix domain-containing protein n=1 Tax=Pseudodesulfovibrio hydrargyri TaxID=2125990 RepID=UPI0008FB1D13
MHRSSPEYIQIISDLKGRRKELRLTQKEVAESLGKSQSFMAKIENYEQELSVTELFQLLKVLNLDMSKYFTKTKV